MKLLLLIFLIPGFAAAQMIPNSGGYNFNPTAEQTRTLTVNASFVSSGPHTNFPALINFTANNLKSIGNGGIITDAEGDDIRFYASDGTTLLNWEVQTYNAASGNIIAWVRIPSLSTTSTVVMKYGNATITTFQGGTGATTWSSYARVWHMENALTAAGQTSPDATGTGALTTQGSAWASGQTAAAKVGNGFQLNKTNNNYLNFSNIVMGTNNTMEGWINITAADATSFWWGRLSASNTYNWFSAKFREYDGGSDNIVQSGTTSINTWYHYTVTRAGTALNVYVNGASQGSSALGEAFTWNQLGRQDLNSSATIYFDETRQSTAAVSAGWALTNYNTQQNFSTFWTYSAL